MKLARLAALSFVVVAVAVACHSRDGAVATPREPRSCNGSDACEQGEHCDFGTLDPWRRGRCAPGLPTIEDCPKEYIARGLDATRCHFEIGHPAYCGGPVLIGKMLDPQCLCKACAKDDDCTDRAGGACIEALVDHHCREIERACVYPGDACHPSAPCTKGERCLLLPTRATSCGKPTPPEKRRVWQ